MPVDFLTTEQTGLADSLVNRMSFSGTVAKLAMRQPCLIQALHFKTLLTAFRPGITIINAEAAFA
nr:hypothetical protein [Escherichia coli O25b:H4-ST131]